MKDDNLTHLQFTAERTDIFNNRTRFADVMRFVTRSDAARWVRAMRSLYRSDRSRTRLVRVSA